MKLRLIAVGRVRERYVAEAVADFGKRLRRYGAFEEVEVAASRRSDPASAMNDESDRIMRALAVSDLLWLLERTGTQLTSLELGDKLRAHADAGTPRLTIAVAGTFGASDELRARAQFQWSLSRLTLLHEWSRALVLEQLYRAAKIARNEPYHH